ncbi:MAG: hypothetical protein RLZZ416_301 [Candidatus Parcubacteria bacterium]|jgi:hypothetical protein
MSRITLIAYGALILAILAWGTAAAFAWTISQAEHDRRSRVVATRQSSVDAATALRAHALAAETRDSRAGLATLLDVDVVSVADAIETNAKAIGVKAEVSSVLPEGPSASLPGGVSAQAIGFTVGADGSFSNLMRAVALFETLPVPSRIERFDVFQPPHQAGEKIPETWHLDLYIKVLTSSGASV